MEGQHAMNSDLLATPHIVAESITWFEYPKGIGVLIYLNVLEVEGPSLQFLIPWDEIRAALARKDKTDF
jgi:hypothetical protein